jgi:TFIIF-interacting CTD phosphatase-like protein
MRRKDINRRKAINIVLDLDNTLIYSHDSSKIKKDNPEWLSKYSSENMDDDYVVCERPGLQVFLDWLFKNFNVMIWSAASPDYVDFIANKIVKKNPSRVIEHIFNSKHCDESQSHYKGDTKNLNLLWDHYDFDGYGPYNTLIIDDMGHVCKSQPSKSIRIKKFIANENSLNDHVLDDIKNNLSKIKKRFLHQKNKSPSYKLVG